MLLQWLPYSCHPNGGREKAFAGGEPAYTLGPGPEKGLYKTEIAEILFFLFSKVQQPPCITPCVQTLAVLIASCLTWGKGQPLCHQGAHL